MIKNELLAGSNWADYIFSLCIARVCKQLNLLLSKSMPNKKLVRTWYTIFSFKKIILSNNAYVTTGTKDVN
jgi:hypothetical protein